MGFSCWNSEEFQSRLLFDFAACECLGRGQQSNKCLTECVGRELSVENPIFQLLITFYVAKFSKIFCNTLISSVLKFYDGQKVFQNGILLKIFDINIAR